MILVCGEALMDVFAQADTAMGMGLDARVGGSPLNVAIGLARLGQHSALLTALSDEFLGERLRRALEHEGVDLSHAVTVKAPVTLGFVGLNTAGSASYAFYGEGCADRLLFPEHLPVLDDAISALHFGSYSMVMEPVASTHRQLVEQAGSVRAISYDVNIRLNVEPDLARWRDVVQWMAHHSHLLKASSEDIEALRPGEPYEQVANDWLALGVSVVIFTEGAVGVHAFTPNFSVFVPAHTVAVVDTVGAGDTFQAAMLAWLAERSLLNVASLRSITLHQLRDALQFSSAAAAITCSRRGADMPNRDELARFLSETRADTVFEKPPAVLEIRPA
jgi:fructokinase